MLVLFRLSEGIYSTLVLFCFPEWLYSAVVYCVFQKTILHTCFNRLSRMNLFHARSNLFCRVNSPHTCLYFYSLNLFHVCSIQIPLRFCNFFCCPTWIIYSMLVVFCFPKWIYSTLVWFCFPGRIYSIPVLFYCPDLFNTCLIPWSRINWFLACSPGWIYYTFVLHCFPERNYSIFYFIERFSILASFCWPGNYCMHVCVLQNECIPHFISSVI